MSTHTPVCDLLGIERPIVEAPLSADPRLPAAVSNAGGLGTLGLGWADDARDLVRQTAALTDRPFAGNFVLAFDQHRRIDQALSAGLRIVSLFWGDPEGYVDSVHDAGGPVEVERGLADGPRIDGKCRMLDHARSMSPARPHTSTSASLVGSPSGRALLSGLSEVLVARSRVARHQATS